MATETDDLNNSLLQCRTKIDKINHRYYIHDKIKSTEKTAHFIVEDMDYEVQLMEEDE